MGEEVGRPARTRRQETLVTDRKRYLESKDLPSVPQSGENLTSPGDRARQIRVSTFVAPIGRQETLRLCSKERERRIRSQRQRHSRRY